MMFFAVPVFHSNAPYADHHILDERSSFSYHLRPCSPRLRPHQIPHTRHLSPELHVGLACPFVYSATPSSPPSDSCTSISTRALGPGLQRGRSRAGAAPVISSVVCCSVHTSSRSFFAPIGRPRRSNVSGKRRRTVTGLNGETTCIVQLSKTDPGGRDLNFPFV
jgi:hypothetical protein